MRNTIAANPVGYNEEALNKYPNIKRAYCEGQHAYKKGEPKLPPMAEPLEADYWELGWEEAGDGNYRIICGFFDGKP